MLRPPQRAFYENRPLCQNETDTYTNVISEMSVLAMHGFVIHGLGQTRSLWAKWI